MSDAMRIEETAARWLMRQEDAGWSGAEEACLAAWLDESMAHKAAYWRLRHGWRGADRIAALGEQIRREPRPRHWLSRPAGRLASPRYGAALAASLALAMGLGTAAWWRFVPGDQAYATSYATPVGGQRELALKDGSRVELNTATVVRTAVGPQRREVWLDRGEAFFDVARDPDRPFVVHAGSRTISVLGTRFSVRRSGGQVTVAVLSGRVRIDDASAAVGAGETRSARAAIVGTGDMAVARADATLVAIAAPASVEAVTAWRDGVLIFDNQTLAGAAAEFNRYFDRPIRIADPAAGRMRIGGSFRIHNRDAFLNLLQSAYGLHVRVTPDSVEIDR